MHLRLYKYAQALLVDKTLGLGAAYQPYTPSQPPPGGLTEHKGYEGSPYASVWYEPEKLLTDPSVKADAATVADEQALSSHLDNAFRAAYLGSNATYAYMAFEQSEV